MQHADEAAPSAEKQGMHAAEQINFTATGRPAITKQISKQTPARQEAVEKGRKESEFRIRIPNC